MRSGLANHRVFSVWLGICLVLLIKSSKNRFAGFRLCFRPPGRGMQKQLLPIRRTAQSPNRCQFGLCQSCLGLEAGLLPHRRQIRAAAMRYLGRHANALAQRRVRVNRLVNIHRVRAHLDGQGNLADHVAGVGANHAASQNLAVAMGFG